MTTTITEEKNINGLQFINYVKHKFNINNNFYKNSVITINDKVMDLPIKNLDEISGEHIEILEKEKSNIDLLIITCGDTFKTPNQELLDKLREIAPVEYTTTLSGFSLASSLIAEGRNIACVLINNPIVYVDLVKTTKTWIGKTIEPISYKQPEVTVKDIIIPAGQKLPIHSHPDINVAYLIEGELTVYSRDSSKTLHLDVNGSNNLIVESINSYHYAINYGKVDARVIVWYVAEKGEKLTSYKL